MGAEEAPWRRRVETTVVPSGDDGHARATSGPDTATGDVPSTAAKCRFSSCGVHSSDKPAAHTVAHELRCPPPSPPPPSLTMTTLSPAPQ